MDSQPVDKVAINRRRVTGRTVGEADMNKTYPLAVSKV